MRPISATLFTNVIRHPLGPLVNLGKCSRAGFDSQFRAETLDDATQRVPGPCFSAPRQHLSRVDNLFSSYRVAYSLDLMMK